MSNLIREVITLPELFTIRADAEEARNALALRSRAITVIATAEANQVARTVAVELRTYLKKVEEMRVELTAPLLAAQRLLKTLSDDHVTPLQDELQRLERLATTFLEAENRRVAAAEETRRLAFEKAERERIAAEEAARKAAQRMQTEAGMGKALAAEEKAIAATAKVNAIVMAPLPKVNRASGQSMRKKLCYEVLDIKKIYAARPELCTLEIKASAVQACCVPEAPVPGLRLYWQNVSTFSSR